MHTALIVDDEQDIRELLTFNLTKEGWETLEAEDGLTALELAKEKPDVILLDLMLPDMDGLAVYKSLQEDGLTADIPVLMMTAQLTSQNDVIRGLDLGADDYVQKPFGEIKELILRLRNVMRRTGTVQTSTLKSGPFALDRNTLKFFLDGDAVDLTATEFKLLLILIENPARDQTRAELLQRIWGYDERIQTRTLDTHVKRLREKLGEYGDCVETVRGVGYRFRPPSSDAAPN